ncbi:hypothetical protein I7V28_17050 [Lelliottia amnigena]|uniref:hypothetical protein n=1 Tax=Lelliottia amnigena TaxID=61646 RepID=UPI00192CC54F|nr:hypothetical protein [Lelliottia amnigena]MBL5922788.1 hypothetical protein [Lelliottia amnigena]
MNTYELIKDAILNKKQITAVYDGYFREMCPHALGTKNGKQQALFFQFGGESSKGKIDSTSPFNWRCLRLVDLEDVRIRDGEWYTADNHSKAQTCVDQIDYEVKL